MKKTFLVLFALASYTILFSQENFSNGYIITNVNDTIYGEISLRSSEVNQNQCTFISDRIKNEVQTFLPGQIKGYRFSDIGRYYIAKNIKIGNIVQNMFAEYLLEGQVSLFYFVHEGQSYFLFEELGKDPFYITQKPEYIDQSIGRLRVDNSYIGGLTYRFNDSERTLKLIQKAKFTQKSMIEITKFYNDENCLSPDGVCVIFVNPDPDKKPEIFKYSVYSGVQYSSLNSSLTTGGSVMPIIGVQCYINNPQRNEKLGVLADISFSKMNYSTDYPYVRQRLRYNSFIASIKVGGKYYFTKTKIRPSVGAGVLASFLIDAGSDEISEHYLPNYGFYFGGYLSAGIDFNIRKSQFIFLNFDWDLHYKSSTDLNRLKMWEIKIGYTF